MKKKWRKTTESNRFSDVIREAKKSGFCENFNRIVRVKFRTLLFDYGWSIFRSFLQEERLNQFIFRYKKLNTNIFRNMPLKIKLIKSH